MSAYSKISFMETCLFVLLVFVLLIHVNSILYIDVVKLRVIFAAPAHTRMKYQKVGGRLPLLRYLQLKRLSFTTGRTAAPKESMVLRSNYCNFKF